MVQGYKTYNTSQINAQAEIAAEAGFYYAGAYIQCHGQHQPLCLFGYQPELQSLLLYSLGYYDKKERHVYTLDALNPTTGTEYLNYSPNGAMRRITTSVYFQCNSEL